MQIELTEDQIDDVVYGALLSLEEDNPTDKKLHKAIKRILSYSIVPTDWEMIYEEDFVDYVLNKKQKPTQVQGYDLSDHMDMVDTTKPSLFTSYEEQKIEKTRKGNK
jgi:hypothetical protein